jgi:hypothetical protein
VNYEMIIVEKWSQIDFFVRRPRTKKSSSDHFLTIIVLYLAQFSANHLSKKLEVIACILRRDLCIHFIDNVHELRSKYY